MTTSRREFLGAAALAGAGLSVPLQGQEKSNGVSAQPIPSRGKAVIVCKYTGMQSIDGAYELMRRGGDTLDAAIWVLKAQEDDPNDDTVGLGGLPNEDGEVELDASVMHGPTRRAGAVGAVRRIRNASLLAKAVMEHTGHVMLVGEGVYRVAKLYGFKEEDLLTEHSRKIWQLWKESMSDQDWWGPSIADPKWTPPTGPISELREQRLREQAQDLGIPPQLLEVAVDRVLHPPTGTIPCITLNEKGEMSAAVSTSGLAWKIPGRLGDAPVIGAGIYLDPEVGGVGTTGNGEENIKISGARIVVENMRRGMSPHDAAIDVLERLVHNYNRDMTRLRYINLVFHVLRRDGAYAGVALWGKSASGKQLTFAVHDGEKRVENVSALLEGNSSSWPPVPVLPKAK